MSKTSISYTLPEGCHAAVIGKDELVVPGSFLRDPVRQAVAQIICGERNVDLSEQYPSTFLDDQRNFGRAAESLGNDVTRVLGAMCLGCPYNTNRTSAVDQA